VNSQNRMNAGAEYVLYRIWAALRDENGIHAESLFACVGALAGYACQVAVRQAGALPGADAAKFTLTSVEASDGETYFEGDALDKALRDSPLSVWSFVGRAVQKLDEPLPDVEDIVRYVSKTVGTSVFGVPRVRREHRPRLPAIVYLRQVWPQVLPIAERFCRKPGQLPVLFGIALQRAIEHTESKLGPTLGASIAMECAVAMSKVTLHSATFYPAPAELPESPAQTAPSAQAKAQRASVAQPKASSATAPVAQTTASSAIALVAQRKSSRATTPAAPPRSSRVRAPAAQTKSPSASVPLQQLAMRVAAPPARAGIRANASNRRRSIANEETNRYDFRARIASVPPAVRMAAIASLAFVTVAGAMWKTDKPVAQAQSATRVERKLQTLVRNDSPASDQPATVANASTQNTDAVPVEQFTDARMQAVPVPQPTQDDSGYGATTTADAQMAANSADGSSESVPPPDLLPASGPADQIE
jgi:hypothetical protein